MPISPAAKRSDGFDTCRILYRPPSRFCRSRRGARRALWLHRFRRRPGAPAHLFLEPGEEKRLHFARLHGNPRSTNFPPRGDQQERFGKSGAFTDPAVIAGPAPFGEFWSGLLARFQVELARSISPGYQYLEPAIASSLSIYPALPPSSSRGSSGASASAIRTRPARRGAHGPGACGSAPRPGSGAVCRRQLLSPVSASDEAGQPRDRGAL